MKYVVTVERTDSFEIIVDADSEKLAKQKAFDIVVGPRFEEIPESSHTSVTNIEHMSDD